MSKRSADGASRAAVWSCLLGLAIWLAIFPLAQAGEIRYDKGNRRDPFQPLIGPHAFRGGRAGRNSFPLEGIVYDPKKDSYAVIGGEIYREGETIDGAKLIKVLSDRIILHQESDEIVIWLREEILEAGKKEGRKK